MNLPVGIFLLDNSENMPNWQVVNLLYIYIYDKIINTSRGATY